MDEIVELLRKYFEYMSDALTLLEEKDIKDYDIDTKI